MLTGRLLKASGRMDESASQALVCRVGCWVFCRAPGSGPFSITNQKVTACSRDSKHTHQMDLINNIILQKEVMKKVKEEEEAFAKMFASLPQVCRVLPD